MLAKIRAAYVEDVGKRLVMKDSSRIERRVKVPYSDRWWTEPEPLLRAMELGSWSKISNLASFPERIRARCKTFTWPRPATRSYGTNAERKSS